MLFQALGFLRQLARVQDFLAEVAKNDEAKAFYDTLGRTTLFSIYHRLHTAKKPETRRKRMDDILAKLARREKI